MTLETVQKKEMEMFTKDKVELLKRTICKGSDDNEFQLFLHACKRTGLDPFMRQIHAVKRYDGQSKREVMSIQTGIDGYRLIADRTRRYMPGRETTFQYGPDGQLTFATAYIKKRDDDGVWHEISATAYYSEYVATTRDGSPNKFWREKPHIMLGKCAEAICLRKAFPADLSGIYTAEEMEQASNTDVVKPQLSEEQEQALVDLIDKDTDPSECHRKLLLKCQAPTIKEINPLKFDKVAEWLYDRLAKQKPVEVIAQQSEEELFAMEEAAM